MDANFVADLMNVKIRNFETAFGREPSLEDLIAVDQEKDEFWDFKLHIGSLFPQIGLPSELASSIGFADDSKVGSQSYDFAKEILVPEMAKLLRRSSGTGCSPLTDVHSPSGLFTVISSVLAYNLREEAPEAFEEGIYELNTVSLLFATKSLRTFRSVYLLSRQGSFNDALTLVRSLYESYVLIKYIITIDDGLEKAVIAPFGLRTGSHEYMRKPGGATDRSRVLRKIDSRQIDIITRRDDMVKQFGSSIDLEFDSRFYDHLSARTHPDMIVFFEEFWDNDHTYFEHRAGTAFLMAVPIMILIISSLCSLNLRRDTAREELLHAVQTSCDAWCAFVGPKRFTDEPDRLRRMKLIMVDWQKQSRRGTIQPADKNESDIH